jgi:tRNA threonylcarbamoyladenosine biosynthesis protein TsaE
LNGILTNEEATVAAGRRLGAVCIPGTVLFLEGDLGAGKTTFCRGFLRAFDYSASVKSPTYTLVEPYELPSGLIYHFDLYRLGHAEELEYMGIRDYFSADSICLIEWPERGAGVLPLPDLKVRISVHGNGRFLDVVAVTPLGEQLAANYREAER